MHLGCPKGKVFAQFEVGASLLEKSMHLLLCLARERGGDAF